MWHRARQVSTVVAAARGDAEAHTLLVCVFLDSTSTVSSSTAAKNNHLKLMAYVCIKLLNWHWSLNTAHPNCCLLCIYSLSEIPQGFFSVAGVRRVILIAQVFAAS